VTAIRAQIADLALARMQDLDPAECELMPTADPINFTAIHIFDNGQFVMDGEAGSTRYRLRLTIEAYFEEAGGAATYAELNATYAAIVTTMVADPPMDTLAETITEADMRIGVATLASKPRQYLALDFDIEFSTSRDDPTQAA
jgi:hypothetical protein